MEQGLKDKIIDAIDEEFLLELRQGVLGYQKVTTRQMIDHLRKRGGGLDHIDVMKIRKEQDEPWDCTKNPTAYFARVEKNVHLLSLVKPTPIVTDMTKREASQAPPSLTISIIIIRISTYCLPKVGII